MVVCACKFVTSPTTFILSKEISLVPQKANPGEETEKLKLEEDLPGETEVVSETIAADGN